MAAKPQAERQRSYRERQRANGFRETVLWVHEEDRAAVQKYVRKLAKERRRAIEQEQKKDDAQLDWLD